MKLIVGLGNPGRQYEKTRHNAGFLFADRVAQAYGVPWSAAAQFQGEVARIDVEGHVLFLLKPLTYMNRSGFAVGAFCRYYKIAPQEVVVAHDELDFAPGLLKLKRGGGHGGHNGLRDIVSHLGTADFARVRIGIGHPGDRSKVVDYVLSPPSKDECEAIDLAVDAVLGVLPDLAAGRFDQAVQRLHSDCGPAENRISC